jgi:uncharacterized protein with HEPN domain
MASHNVKKLLFDVHQAGELIASFVSGKSHEDYRNDRMLQSAVERQFEIIGEALRQTIGIDPEVENRISGTRRIIDFRNRLIHGYAEISTRVVWGIIEEHLPRLLSEVQKLIAGKE